ncbi:hypothetical protein K491DRAFT_562333, partial [Lophiostoma macrostomum CBS 122681]
LFNNPLFSDVTIRQIYRSKVKEYHAHKAILCFHSTWFLKELTGKYKETTDNVIKVHNDDPVHFETMLKFFY